MEEKVILLKNKENTMCMICYSKTDKPKENLCNNFEIGIAEDGLFYDVKNPDVVQVKEEDYDIRDITNVLKYMLECDGKYTYADIGETVNNMMISSGISEEQRKETLRQLLNQYKKYEHLHNLT